MGLIIHSIEGAAVEVVVLIHLGDCHRMPLAEILYLRSDAEEINLEPDIIVFRQDGDGLAEHVVL